MPASPRPPHDFEAGYAAGGPLPWDIGRPQPAFVRLAESGGLVGLVLDVGCGTGEHALLAASLGHDATGVDIAPKAIERARAKASERNLSVRFQAGDALNLAELGQQFDTVLDCGLFHGFEDDERTGFVRSLASVVPSGGRYHMLCFSDRQPGDWGPRRITQAEIHSSFGSGWTVDSIDPILIEVNLDPPEAQGWQVTATRL